MSTKKKVTLEQLEAIVYQEKPKADIVEELNEFISGMRKKFFGAGYHKGYDKGLSEGSSNSKV